MWRCMGSYAHDLVVAESIVSYQLEVECFAGPCKNACFACAINPSLDLSLKVFILLTNQICHSHVVHSDVGLAHASDLGVVTAVSHADLPKVDVSNAHEWSTFKRVALVIAVIGNVDQCQPATVWSFNFTTCCEINYPFQAHLRVMLVMVH
ncbi:hypothetical protein [Guangdong greater green snake arterivirus]|uniref:Uncharacterized protein n=1 Tax=Guangdong greater green snake arterivirus TaxID=2116442 RepID=A0A2P1GMY2_9NIDO|nr:hypothetical protein [Guangdong greater green snake arterivirus]AVM87324.1 hypothetical protein [Guangdong greater green snake arterivirus]